jgi:hypothetical protein
MKLFTKKIHDKLLKNGCETHQALTAENADGNTPAHYPVVKLFTPDANCTWLLSEIEPDTDEDIAFGLCDLGLGFPELGSVSITEIKTVRGRFGLPVERDKYFTANKPLIEYADQARIDQYIHA